MTTTPPAELCHPDNLPEGWSVDDWFAHSKRQYDRYARAKARCFQCPLYQACAQYALDEGIPHGIFGGMDGAERRREWPNGVPPKDHLASLYAEVATLTRFRHLQEYVA
jgi:hypothetical protein